jgi:hypothetical protein
MGLFSKASTRDQIALLAIYMPILRSHVTSYIRTWNIHRIRKQKNRPYVTHGKPYMNYNHPTAGVQKYGFAVGNESLDSLWNDVKDWGK